MRSGQHKIKTRTRDCKYKTCKQVFAGPFKFQLKNFVNKYLWSLRENLSVKPCII